jgi:hypothetical protein
MSPVGAAPYCENNESIRKFAFADRFTVAANNVANQLRVTMQHKQNSANGSRMQHKQTLITLATLTDRAVVAAA